MTDHANARNFAGTWESDQALISFVRARLRELELENPQGTEAHRYIRTSQRLVEEYVDCRRAAGRNGLHGREALVGTNVWGLRTAVIYVAELWANHEKFRDEWQA